MRTLLLPLLLIGLAACSETSSVTSDTSASPDGLALTVDQSAYAPGASATVAFQNRTEEAVSLAEPLACATVEQETGGGWEPVPSDRMCAAVLVPVEAGEATTVEIAVPEQAGTYRLSQTAYPGEGDGVTVVSAPFQVR